MELTRIALSNVRNYAALDFEPAPGLNVFVGANAQGKSNLLEAISLLGTGKSFRTNRESDLIRDGLDVASVIGEAKIRAGTVKLGCTIAASAKGTRKLYAVNGQGVRYAKFLGSLRVVTFVPADLHLVGGPPGERRALLNVALSQELPAYYRELARYQKALAQKSAVLRSLEPDRDLLEIYNATLVEAGTALVLARRHFVAAVSVAAARMHALWTDEAESLVARYEPNVPFETPTQDGVSGALFARLRAVAPAELARKMALAGPHRDDLTLLLDGRPLAAYGSQGQQRTAVLALKIGEYTVMHERSGEAPLLLLDDVLSELDASRAQAFLDMVGTYGQAFVTTTHLPEGLAPAAVFDITAGTLRAAV
ncbi:MAG: DNA replication/repair protein RecF [Candidatus Eremiobacteraeota bacterium]|nr:DNA replication/repair protein RecF [Candidatus Eremiobacteraeota bacterium]